MEVAVRQQSLWLLEEGENRKSRAPRITVECATFDVGLHEVCVPVGGRAGVRYVITKFSRMDSLPNFVTHGAPLRALRARELRYYVEA